MTKMTKIKQTIVISLLLAGCLVAVKPAQALTYQELLDYFHQPQVLGATTTGLVGYWNFDEGSGTTAADSSGNGNIGTLSGSTLPTWVSGKIGQALHFDGSSSYVTTSGTPQTLNFSGPFTISVWEKADANTAGMWVSKQSGGGSTGSGFSLSSSCGRSCSAVFSLYQSDGTAKSVSLFLNSYISAWNNILAYYDGSSMTLCINGICGTPVAVNGFLAAGSQILTIGKKSYTNSFYWPGTLDDIRIYNRALTAQEVLDVYNDTGSGTPPPPPSGDTTAPSVPASLTATSISFSQINLSWAASTDNVGVTGYKIYRGGVQIGTSINNNYNDNSLSPSTAYSYAVSAYDAVGNDSPQSTAVGATTQAMSGNRVDLLNGSGNIMSTFTTIQACANVVVAGGACVVYPGLYDERVTAKNSGTASARITYEAAAGFAQPKVRGFSLTGKNYTTIEGFEITNAVPTYENAANVWISSSTGVSILNNTFKDTIYPCLRVNGSILTTIDGNTASYCGETNVIDGTATGTFAIAAGVNDQVKYSVQGVSFTVTLTPGTRTLAQICTDINAVTPGVCNSNGDFGNIALLSTMTGPTSNITLQSVTNNAYATLGLTVRAGNMEGWAGFFSGGSLAVSNQNSGVLIENNSVSHVSDYVVTNDTKVVVRNNYWGPSDQVNSGHIDGIQSGAKPGITYLLDEGNVSTYNNNYDNHVALFQGLDNNEIVRYNSTFQTYDGIDCSRQNNASGPGVYVYNNTFYGKPSGNTTYFGQPNYMGVLNCGKTASANNHALNNIWYDSSNVGASNPYIYVSTSSLTRDYDLWYAGTGNPKEAHAVNADPLFVNGSSGDFHLQSASPAINAGGPLTTTISSGSNSVSLQVGDASVFQDGWAGVEPDTIAVGSTGNVAAISSIDYNTNTITLASPLSWLAGAPVYLYKNSSGQQVLYGSAPDIGAYEYTGSAPPPSDTTPPTAPTGVTVN
jgi:hypothetical protein